MGMHVLVWYFQRRPSLRRFDRHYYGAIILSARSVRLFSLHFISFFGIGERAAHHGLSIRPARDSRLQKGALGPSVSVSKCARHPAACPGTGVPVLPADFHFQMEVKPSDTVQMRTTNTRKHSGLRSHEERRGLSRRRKVIVRL